VAKRLNLIPGRLRRKVPTALLMAADGHVFWTIFGLGLAIFFLYGPVVGTPDHNGLRYLLGPLICPSIPAAWYIWRPLNPYSGYRGRWGTLGPMLWKDKTDPDCARLVELFRSDHARRFLIGAAQRMSLVMLIPLAVAAFVLRKNLNWSIPSFWQVQGLLGAMIGTWIAVFASLMTWGLRTWAVELAPEEVDSGPPRRQLR
jgi:hypothetical protein